MAEPISALNADVTWRTNTGETEVEVERLRRTFHSATQDMSTQSLKLVSAQDKLDRALVRYGTSSRQARDAEIALRREMQAGAATAERQAASFGHAEREVGRFSRGALTGSGALRGLGRSVAFASFGFLGSFGLVFGLRSALTAGEDLERGQRALDAQIRANHESLRLEASLLDAAKQRMAGLGFTASQTETAFARLDRATGDQRKAFNLLGLTADLAAARHIDLEQAALIVGKVVNGNVTLLRRYGIGIEKGATVTEALATAQRKLAGQAAANVTAEQKLHVAFQNTEATIGKALLPTVVHYENALSRWLGKAENQRRIQRDVNEVARDGTKILHGFADGLHAVEAVAGPVVSALGGIEQTAKLALEAMAVYKLAKIAGAIRGIGIQWGFVKTQAAEAAGAERAATGGAVGGAGAFGIKALAGIGGAVATAELFTILSARGDQGGTLGQYAGGKYPILDRIGHDQNFPNDIAEAKRPAVEAIWLAYRRGKINAATAEAALQKLNPYGDRSLERSPDRSAETQRDARYSARGGRPANRPRASLDYQLALSDEAIARAGTTATQADDRAALVRRKALLERKIARTKDLKERTSALQDLASTDQQIAAIDKAAADKVKARHDAEVRAAKKREEEEKRRVAEEKRRAAAAKRHAEEREHARRKAILDSLGLEERKLTNAVLAASLTKTLADDKKSYDNLIAFYTKEEHDGRLTAKQHEDYVAKELRARKAEAARLNAKKTGAGAASVFAEAASEFRTYGSNISEHGLLSSQDARGLLGAILREIQDGNRTAKKTAGHTARIGKKTSPIHNAAELAGHGIGV